MALVQAVAKDQGGSGGTFTITTTDGWVASSSGSAIIVAILSAGGFTSAPTISDNKSNTYTIIDSDQGVGATSNCAWWVCANAASGTNSISVANGGKITMFAIEESGLATSSIIDAHALNTNQAGTTTPTSGNVSPTATNDIAYAFHAAGSSTNTFTVGSGWTALTGTGITTGLHNNTVAGTSMFMERQALSGSSAVAGTATTGSTQSGTDSGIVALFQAAILVFVPYKPPPIYIYS